MALELLWDQIQVFQYQYRLDTQQPHGLTKEMSLYSITQLPIVANSLLSVFKSKKGMWGRCDVEFTVMFFCRVLFCVFIIQIVLSRMSFL